VVNPRAMSHAIPSPRSRRTTSSERAQLLSAFDRSGLSAAAFARQHQINYTTFCGWRQRREKARTPDFVEVELPEPGVSSNLVVEVGARIRLRISSADQIPLAATLLNQLHRQEEAC
jgi:transposase-like protein